MKKQQRNAPIKDLSKHVTAHTCSNCSTIYCEYSEELSQEIIDSVDTLLKSTIDVAKDVTRTIEQKYTEDDIINFADYMSTRHNTNHGLDIDKDDLKQWEKHK